MPQGETYIKLAKQTVTSATSSITFTNISQDYTDLVLVSSAKFTAGSNSVLAARFGFGSISVSNIYSYTYLQGAADGATASTLSSFGASFALLQGGNNAVPENSNTFGTFITNFMRYSDNTVGKSVISRGNSVGGTPSQAGVSFLTLDSVPMIN